jgi:hypothetical protein
LTSEGFARIERELQQERALALRRIAETFEGLLGELRDLEARARTAAGEQRRALAADHARVRERAILYRWYLIVQREAVGFVRHEDVDRRHPVPGPLAE